MTGKKTIRYGAKIHNKPFHYSLMKTIRMSSIYLINVTCKTNHTTTIMTPFKHSSISFTTQEIYRKQSIN